MNYCSIQDAWGKSNISSQYKEYMTNTNEQNIDFNKEQIDRPPSRINVSQNDLLSQLQQLKPEQLSNILLTAQTNDCSRCIQHVQVCRICQNRFRQQYRSPLVDKINELINYHRDNIVLVLIVIFILVVFNLIANLNK